MPTYISLCNWTDQGIKNFKDTVSRGKKAEDAMGKLGVRFQSLYWTVGPYDLVAIVDAESATAALLALGAQGNIRTTTMRAYDADAMSRIVGKLG
jgi:uncharacterized protein with GYD domain